MISFAFSSPWAFTTQYEHIWTTVGDTKPKKSFCSKWVNITFPSSYPLRFNTKSKIRLASKKTLSAIFFPSFLHVSFFQIPTLFYLRLRQVLDHVDQTLFLRYMINNRSKI